MKDYCICCYKKEKLNPNGMCNSCEQGWVYSGMSVGNYIYTWWITETHFVVGGGRQNKPPSRVPLTEAEIPEVIAQSFGIDHNAMLKEQMEVLNWYQEYKND